MAPKSSTGCPKPIGPEPPYPRQVLRTETHGRTSLQAAAGNMAMRGVKYYSPPKAQYPLMRHYRPSHGRILRTFRSNIFALSKNHRDATGCRINVAASTIRIGFSGFFINIWYNGPPKPIPILEAPRVPYGGRFHSGVLKAPLDPGTLAS